MKKLNHRLIKQLIRIRCVEQSFLDIFSQGKLNGTVHTCIGQELSAAAFAGQIKKSDFVFSNHRCHGHFIAYTKQWKGLISELMGKENGVCGGVGSSQHLQLDNFYSNGIQGGIVPLSAGFSLANKLKKNNNIGVVYIGDGTLGEGVVYETMNFIQKNDIPLIIVCENNQYAQSTPKDSVFSGSIKGRAESFGIEFRESDTFDKDIKIMDEAKDSINWVRDNKKPIFHLVNTYRLKAHSKGDDDRDHKEIKSYEDKDILNLLLKEDPVYYNKIYNEINDEVLEYIDLATNQNELDPKLYFEQNIDNNEIKYSDFIPTSKRLITRINESFSNLIENDDVVFIGEDIVDPYGGAFKATRGLSTKRTDRVIPTTISEQLIAGISNGLALNGFIPFTEFMFGDFTALAFDQFLNHSAKVYNMYNKQVSCPVVFRTPMGGHRGYGPTHSQTLEKHFIGMDEFSIYALNRFIDPKIIYDFAYKRKHPSLIIENKVDYGKKDNFKISDEYEFLITDENLPSLLIKPKYDIPETVIITYGGNIDLIINELDEYFYECDKLVKVLVLSQIDPIPEKIIYETCNTAENVIFVEEGIEGGSVGDHYISWMSQNLKPKKYKSLSSVRTTIPSVKSLEQLALISKSKINNYLKSI